MGSRILLYHKRDKAFKTKEIIIYLHLIPKTDYMKYLLLLLFPVLSQAQTFFVSGNDTYSVRKVSEKVRFEGYQVTDSAHADYIVNLLIDGAYKYMSFKRAYKGYIMITDRATGKEVARTPMAKGNPDVYDGYNASYRIFGKIDKKYLPAELKKCPKKEVANK